MNNSIQTIRERFHNATIGQKIIAICLILAFIPPLFLGIVAYGVASGAVYSDIRTNLVNQVEDMRDGSDITYQLTQNNLNQTMNVLHDNFYSHGTPDIVGDQLVLTSGSDRYVVNNNFEIVDHIQTLAGAPATIFLKKGDQAVRISTNILKDDGSRAVGTMVSQRVYDKVITGGQTYYGTADILGKKYIAIYEPIKNSRGEIIGILFTGENAKDTIGVLEKNIRAKKIGNNGYMYVLNATGMTILHPTREGKNDSNLPFINEIITKKNGFIQYNYNGDEKIAAFSYYEPLDWIIVASSSLSDFTGPVDTIRNTIIIIIILAILAGMVVALWFGRSISRRMNALVTIADRITEGDLAGSLEESTDGDEIGVLSRAFDHVVQTVQSFRDEIQMVSKAAAGGRLDVRGNPAKFKGDYASIIKGVNDTVDAMTMPVAEAMRLSDQYAQGNFTARVNPDLAITGDFIAFKDALDKIGTDVSNGIGEVKIQMKELVAGVSLVSGSVNEVTGEIELAGRSIDDVSQGTGQVAQIAGAVSTLADQSGNTTRQILSAMQDLATTVSSVSTKMEEVSILTSNAADLSGRGKDMATKAEHGMAGIIRSSGEIEQMVTDISTRMEEIGRIVDIISGISDQTNLLALNAAIEAARAGEAGLGFAVVAGEVKELASGSQKSAETIAQIIGDLQQKTRAIAGTVQISLSDVRSGSEAVEETLSIFNDIVSSIGDINRNMNEVAAASEEQAASVEEVTATVHEFETMVQQTAKESIGLAAASEESSAAVSQIVTMIEEVSQSMNQIRSAVSDAEEAFSRVNEEMDRFRV